MKAINRKIYIASLVLLGLVCSCTDLDETPHDVLTQDDLGNSPEILQALTAPVYTSLTNVMF